MKKRKLRRRYGHMAYDRETFKDRVEEYITGAWFEFYKARSATKNGQTRWVMHWMREVRDLLDRLQLVIIQHEIRGFKNKRRAVEQVVEIVKSKDASFRRGAEGVVRRDFKLRKLRVELNDTDRDAFWALVHQAVEDGLQDT
jgi:hypothetical protein